MLCVRGGGGVRCSIGVVVFDDGVRIREPLLSEGAVRVVARRSLPVAFDAGVRVCAPGGVRVFGCTVAVSRPLVFGVVPLRVRVSPVERAG